MITILYKYQDDQLLKIVGHLTKTEIQSLKHEGYREREPQVNKRGIRVVN